MPAILAKRIPIKLLWTSPNVRETFGDELVDSILTAAPDAVIYNTRKHGKVRSPSHPSYFFFSSDLNFYISFISRTWSS